LHEVFLTFKAVKYYFFLVIPQKLLSRTHGEILISVIRFPVRVTDLRLTFLYRFQAPSDALHMFGFVCIISNHNCH
jgi:hypothetical protein